MSSIGISVIEDGRIAYDYDMVIDPQEPFDWFNTNLTGIDANSVKGKPTFPEVWRHLEPVMSDAVLVAHNATFDLRVLRHCLEGYGIPWKPSVRYVCTVRMGRSILPGESHKLNLVCDRLGIALDHHRAASDSHACAEVLLRYARDGEDVTRHIREYRMS